MVDPLDNIYTQVSDYRIIRTLSGEWKLVDASDDDAPIATFVNEFEARMFWTRIIYLATIMEQLLKNSNTKINNEKIN